MHTQVTGVEDMGWKGGCVCVSAAAGRRTPGAFVYILREGRGSRGSADHW